MAPSRWKEKDWLLTWERRESSTPGSTEPSASTEAKCQGAYGLSAGQEAVGDPSADTLSKHAHEGPHRHSEPQAQDKDDSWVLMKTEGRLLFVFKTFFFFNIVARSIA